MQSLSTWAAAFGVPLISAESDQRLASAYQATFAGNASKEDAEIVLVDLAVVTRFYEHMSPDAVSTVLHHADGRRAVMRRLIGFVADQRILGELQIAALREAIVIESNAKRRKPK